MLPRFLLSSNMCDPNFIGKILIQELFILKQKICLGHGGSEEAVNSKRGEGLRQTSQRSLEAHRSSDKHWGKTLSEQRRQGASISVWPGKSGL